MNADLISLNKKYLDQNGSKRHEWLEKLEPYKNFITPETVISFLFNECRINKRILECSPQSILNCLIQSAQYGLKISSVFGYAYVVPYKGELNFQIGYQGMVELLYRQPSIAKINTRIVYQNEIEEHKFQVQYGKDEFLHHIPTFSKKGGAALYYADLTFKDGTYKFAILSLEEALEAQEKSPSKTKIFWTNGFDSMALGKAIRKLYKTLPKSPSLPELPDPDDESLVITETGEITQKQPKTNSTDTLADDLIDLSVDSEIIDVEAETVDTEAHRVKEAD